MTRAAIYCRVSSEEQAAEGKSSIQTQLDDCRALAARLGWIVTVEFIEDKRYRVGKRLIEPSGARADRPQWKAMLAALAEGRADALIAWHSTRLFRGYRPMLDLLDVLDAHPAVRVELVKETFNKEFAVIHAWAAKKESDDRNMRVVFGMAGRAKKGLPPSSHSHFFKPILEPGTGEKLGYEFDETYRPHFDAMARLFLERHTYMDIAVRLGVNPLSGRRWHRMTVRDILRNPYYRGRLDYGHSVGPVRFSIPTQHRAVWDAETCAAIAIEMERRTRLGGPRTGTVVFSGLVHCGYCGRVMAGGTMKSKQQPDGRVLRQYVCQWRYRAMYGDIEARQEHPPNCIVEHKLIGLIRDLAADLDGMSAEEKAAFVAGMLPAAKSDDSGTRARLVQVEAQIAEMEPELGRVKNATTRGLIDAELSKLRAEAALLAEHIQLGQPAAMVDYPRMVAGWAIVGRGPAWMDLPDPDLRILMADCFPAIYVAEGQIVAPPSIVTD